MGNQEQREELARICRCQAAMSTAPEVRSVLIELAERYEREDELEPMSPKAEEPSAADPDALPPREFDAHLSLR